MIEFDSVVKKGVDGGGLNGVSVRFSPGLHVLLGGPKSGKSSFLKIALGVARPDHGQATLTGEGALRSGYVAPNGLFPHLTLKANAALPARISGWTREAIEERIPRLASDLGLGSAALSRYPRDVDRRDAFLANLLRALILQPSLLCLDDPLRDFAPLEGDALRRKIPGLVGAPGRTVVWTTRNALDAAASGGTVHFLSGGRFLQSGTFDELDRAPATADVTAYLAAYRPAATEEARS